MQISSKMQTSLFTNLYRAGLEMCIFNVKFVILNMKIHFLASMDLKT